MFKLTRKLEYALIALSHINKNSNTYSSAKEISMQYMIPRELLAKTLQQMRKLEYIDAIKGPRGGYVLNKKLSSISLTKFIEDLEGPIGLVDCSINDDCLQIDQCSIKVPINKINNNIRSILSNISLSQITNC
jgi:Rrf2 family cysteine metabolism transcriptional repressor